ncbi:MAG: DNA methyltransferase [bacterium]|nr:DNA methyltransferase [bacterium]
MYLDPPFNSNVTYNLPFSSTDQKDFEAVAAFHDTWTWGTQEAELYEELKQSSSEQKQLIAKIVRLTLELRGTSGTDNISAYLLNMGVRLLNLKRVLKESGSIYLHCDPTASHYLKMLMDAVFGNENFRNEIVWHYYNKYSRGRKIFGRNYDQLLFYSASSNYTFNELREEREKPTKQLVRENVDGVLKNKKGSDGKVIYRIVGDKKVDAVWSIPCIQPASKEFMSYPTQKPSLLLELIIEASSDAGDLVLDPFCGCGTTLYSAEKIGRRWIGVDISRYAANLVKSRMLANSDKFKVKLQPNDISVYGLPTTVSEARNLLVEMDGRFEFEKWVCGALGTANMMQRKKPGQRGADGGVDGLLKFYPIRTEAMTQGQREVDEAYAVVQVKSGKVTPDAVRALTQVIEDTPGAMAAVLVAFDDQRMTFDNNANQEMIDGILGDYRKVQFISIEDLLNLPQNPTFLPNIVKMGGRSEAVKLPKTEGLGDDSSLGFEL